MKSTHYSIEFNPKSKTWCLYKTYNDSYKSIIHPLLQSDNKKDCEDRLAEIKKKLSKQGKKLGRISWAVKYNLYRFDELIDTDTRGVLIKKYHVPQRVFNKYFYKKGYKEYRVERIDKLEENE